VNPARHKSVPWLRMKRAGNAGIEVWVTWENGADRFVTGLKPDKGNGYGDFDMQPGGVYAIAVAESPCRL